MIENLDVTSWERLASQADAEHQANLATLNQLQRQRAQLTLQALMTKDADLTKAIDEEISGLERKMAGHLATRQLLATGLENARMLEQAAHDLDRAAVLKIEAQQRAKLAAEVDSKMSDLADALSTWLNSTQATARPDRAAGNVNRAFWHFFKPSRNQSWRRAIAEMSSPMPSMATARPLSSTVDPALAEAESLAQAATATRAEALETLKSLTPAMTTIPIKPRPNRPVAAIQEAA